MEVHWSVIGHFDHFRSKHHVWYRCSSTGSGDHKPELRPPGKVKSYVVKQYVGYVERFEIKVEKHYPRVYKVYRLFKDGEFI